MIAANELRIGNFVQFTPDKHFYEVRSVSKDRLHPINIVEHDGNNRYAIDVSLDALLPIPLTPEILEKCGFKLDSTTDNVHSRYISPDETFSIEIDWRRREEGFDPLTYVGADEVHWCSMGLNIKYLHQLQNLYFALTQEELKIAL